MSAKAEREQGIDMPSHNKWCDCRSLAQIMALLYSSDDCIMIADDRGAPQFFNVAYARIMKEAFGLEMKAGIQSHKRLSDPRIVAFWDFLHQRVLGGEKFRIVYHLELSGGKRYFEFSFCPIIENREVNGFVEIARDITERINLEKHVQTRTAALHDQAENLEEMNTALSLLLEKRKQDKTEIEENILRNIRQMVIPYLEKLKASQLDLKQQVYVTIIESNLEEITSPFAKILSSERINLTPTELKIANFIKVGKTTKEIAELLHSSPYTVDNHRKKIRKKLNLTAQRSNLRVHLMTLI